MVIKSSRMDTKSSHMVIKSSRMISKSSNIDNNSSIIMGGKISMNHKKSSSKQFQHKNWKRRHTPTATTQHPASVKERQGIGGFSIKNKSKNFSLFLSNRDHRRI